MQLPDRLHHTKKHNIECTLLLVIAREVAVQIHFMKMILMPLTRILCSLFDIICILFIVINYNLLMHCPMVKILIPKDSPL